MVKRIYFQSGGVTEWQKRLAQPDLHWKPGFSAMTLAQSWESADGLPPEIASLFGGTEAELLIALPEYKVPLPGSSRGDSQNDIFALIAAKGQTFATMIEGKVDESFDKPLSEWLVNASAGKLERLGFLCDILELKQPLPRAIYYQLLHRAAAAVLESRRFKTDAACMIIHSFSPARKWFDAFEAFASLFGVTAERDKLIEVRSTASPLFIAWATGDQRFRTV
jgi:hypothetical protein